MGEGRRGGIGGGWRRECEYYLFPGGGVTNDFYFFSLGLQIDVHCLIKKFKNNLRRIFGEFPLIY